MQEPEKLYSVSEILRILNIPRYKLVYLFESGKLKPDEFTTLDNRHRVFRAGDIEKIKQALFEVRAK